MRYDTIKRDDNHTQRYTPKLNASFSLPSSVHGFSLAVGYMRDWFLSNFPKNYFKTVHIAGKHVFDDFRRFDIGDYAQRLKPAVTIIPRIDMDYTRETIDSHLGGKELLIRNIRSNESFFNDYKNNIFLGVRTKLLRINFTFRVRLYTKAQQIDVYDNIILGCRVGATQSKYNTVDFHVPYNILLCMARDAKFKVTTEKDRNGNIIKQEIEDPISFCKYLNEHSNVPFIYKYREINGRNEFFTRVTGVLMHINCLDRPDADDGERIGMKDDNFSIELNTVLDMPVPYFYAYYSEDDRGLMVETEEPEESVGIYTIQYTDIPEVTEEGWNQIMNTDYIADETDLKTMSISLKEQFEETFEKPEIINAIIQHCKSIGVSNGRFVKIKAWQAGHELDLAVDYSNFNIKFPNTLALGKVRFAIYLDLSFVNEMTMQLHVG